ncbi:MAG: glucose dehydrogenase [Nitrospiraceae bacterium]|nr:glucose dehydrogenase [Nitrospiraceae bacterium]MSR25327.1 glucose dehydrogenase [Nitrospiraceae bacterium]
MRRWLPVLLLGVGWFCTSGGGQNFVQAEQPLPSIALEPIVSDGLDHPVYVTHAGDGSGRLFVVEQAGRIRIVTQGRLLATPFLDITDRVRHAGEQGLLGLAFHPAYKQNGRFVVNYVRRSDGSTVIAELQVSPDPDRSQTTEKQLLVVSQPYPNHKGGMVEFGPDGFLYIALGDGGSGGDPGNRGQNRNELLGKLLRIDVDHGTPYAVPKDNPFASGGGRSEIFAYGLRNPWRFSFDRQTGELWVADVGQNEWEEIDIVQRGGNYGWRILEGSHCFLPRDGCARDGLIPPVAEYGHDKGRCSITGGYVYRGSRLPALRGVYLYGDFCSGEIFAFADGTQQTLLTTGVRIASFGQDQAGELYVVGHGGTIHRIVEVRH